MSRKIDLTGQRFGSWVVLYEAGRDSRQAVLWRVRCICGTESEVTSGNLRRGRSTSCDRGACHSKWRGGTYHGAHEKVRRLRGKVGEHACVDCGERAEEWSLDQAYAEDPRDEATGAPYSFSDPARYQPRCAACHRHHDANLRASRKAVEVGRLTP